MRIPKNYTYERDTFNSPTRLDDNVVITTKRPIGKKHTNVGWDDGEK